MTTTLDAMNKVQIEIRRAIGKMMDEINNLEALDIALGNFTSKPTEINLPAVVAKVAVKAKKPDPIVKTITNKLYGKKKRKYTKKSKFWGKKKK